MAGNGDWAVRSTNLTLPQFAGPNDAAIVAGTDLPPCMQSQYASAVFFRPANSQVGVNDNDAPVYFIAQRKAIVGPFPTNQVEVGWLLYDPITGRCSYQVIHQSSADNRGGNSLDYLDVLGPFPSPTGGVTQVGSYVLQVGGTATRPALFQILGAGAVPGRAGFTIDGVNQPRGLRAQVASTAPSAAIGAEAIIMTLPTMTFYNNECFNVVCEFDATSSAANTLFCNIRQTNLAGPQLIGVAFTMPAGGTVQHCLFTGKIKRTAGTDLTDNLVVSISASAGTVTARGTPQEVRYCEVWDWGLASDYPNVMTI